MDPQRLRSLAAKSKNPQVAEKLLRKAEMVELANDIRLCTACNLSATCTLPVPFASPTYPSIVLLGEAPGATEDMQNVPFVGRAGKLLDRVLKEAGTSRSQVFLTNTVCCRPPDNRQPTLEEKSACGPWLSKQLSVSKCTVGVTLGKTATAAVTGSADTPRGQPIKLADIIWVPTWHPAYVLRSPKAYPEIVAHIKLALNINNPTPEYLVETHLGGTLT